MNNTNNVHTNRAIPPSTAGRPVARPAAERLEALREAIAPLRSELLSHPLYAAIDSLPRLRRFMNAHVFAVWDFMCLAKRLQRDLTSLDPLWRPPARPSLARFINGLILCEESDVDPDGLPASHLELYLSAMDEVGASTVAVRRFLEALAEGVAVDAALELSGGSAAARDFVGQTLRTAHDGSTVEVMAAFLFGREDLIPEMFGRLLPRWAESRTARRFAYYVARHIEVDGDDHGPAAQRALADLAGQDDEAWRAARRAAQVAIASRIALWDGVRSDLDATTA
jgi:hypothetical protein